ncbi:MAG: hypothetical protein GY953_02350, partial [bacterium]|nr:hypothetical protein [bacterium]
MIETLLANEVLALFAVIATGLLVGRVRVAGLTLGSSGVIFTALAFGHLGVRVPGGVGALGLVLFVYCVGLRAGPSFFRIFVRQGRVLARLVESQTQHCDLSCAFRSQLAHPSSNTMTGLMVISVMV